MDSDLVVFTGIDLEDRWCGEAWSRLTSINKPIEVRELYKDAIQPQASRLMKPYLRVDSSITIIGCDSLKSFDFICVILSGANYQKMRSKSSLGSTFG